MVLCPTEKIALGFLKSAGCATLPQFILHFFFISIFLILLNCNLIPTVSPQSESFFWKGSLTGQFWEFIDARLLHCLQTLLQFTCTQPQLRGKNNSVSASFVKLVCQAFQSILVSYFDILLMLPVNFWFCSLGVFFVLVWGFRETKKKKKNRKTMRLLSSDFPRIFC